MNDMGWRDKDDLDLTNEDIDAMIAEGQAVDIRGPRLPGNGVFISSAPTYGGATVPTPDVSRRPAQLVGAARTHATL